MSSHWDDDEEEEKEDQSKGEDQDKKVRKMPQTNPRFFPATTLTPQAPKPSITEHSGKRSSVTPEKEECICNTIMTLLGHEDQDTSEDID